MKKLLYTLATVVTICSSACACGGSYDEFNTYNTWFFSAFKDDYSFFKPSANSGNINDWAVYLGISYADAEYLVLKVGKIEIEAALNGYLADPKLKFLTTAFVKKHRHALQYLVCAKTIEPYAARNFETYWPWWYYDESPCVSALGEEFIENLQLACKSETDRELKLRYGYQLVRYAHYLHRYSDAVAYFDKYVEPLGIKNEVYYYALNQKAGAEYNLQQYSQAVQNFMNVYLNSTDQKESAYRSIFSFCDGHYTPNTLIQMCKTDEQTFNIYLLLAYNNFVEPLQFAKKVTAINPDAPQARKLIAKQISQLEIHYHEEVTAQHIKIVADNGFRLTSNDEFYNSTIEYLQQMTTIATDTDFWNMALGYAYFLNSDYDLAIAALDKVSAKTKTENPDIQNVYSYIDICQLSSITEDTENQFFIDHKAILEQYPVGNYLCRVLANRYFVVGDYAKAYLLTNEYYTIHEYFPTQFVESVIALAQKNNKTPMEMWLTKNIGNEQITHLKEIVMKGAIAKADIGKAIGLKKKYGIDDKVPAEMFYHNIDNAYGLNYNMFSDYVEDVIGSAKNVSLTATIDALMQVAQGNNAVAAKANYVLGNVFYNMSHVGCCRNYLKGYMSPECFDSYYDGYYNTSELVFHSFDSGRNQQEEFFPMISGTFNNTIPIAEKYFKQAEQLAFDSEFAAHVIFGLIKCDQAINQEKHSWYYNLYASPMFAKLATTDYKSTKYAENVRTYCKYYYYFESYGHEGEE